MYNVQEMEFHVNLISNVARKSLLCTSPQQQPFVFFGQSKISEAPVACNLLRNIGLHDYANFLANSLLNIERASYCRKNRIAVYLDKTSSKLLHS